WGEGWVRVRSVARPTQWDTAIASSGAVAVPIPAHKMGYRNPRAAINALALAVGTVKERCCALRGTARAPSPAVTTVACQRNSRRSKDMVNLLLLNVDARYHRPKTKLGTALRVHSISSSRPTELPSLATHLTPILRRDVKHP